MLRKIISKLRKIIFWFQLPQAAVLCPTISTLFWLEKSDLITKLASKNYFEAWKNISGKIFRKISAHLFLPSQLAGCIDAYWHAKSLIKWAFSPRKCFEKYFIIFRKNVSENYFRKLSWLDQPAVLARSF